VSQLTSGAAVCHRLSAGVGRIRRSDSDSGEIDVSHRLRNTLIGRIASFVATACMFASSRGAYRDCPVGLQNT
jgi:hypothetical protein